MPNPALEYGCANCGAELEDREGGWFRRHVPRRGGKKLPVCPPCASLIDKQGELFVVTETKQ